MLRDIELAHGVAQRDEHRMARRSGVALLQLGFPLVEQEQRLLLVADFIAKVIGDSAIGVDVVEVLVQMFGQKPGDDREVLVMRVREAGGVLLRLFERRSMRGDGVLRTEGRANRQRSKLSGLYVRSAWVVSRE